MSEISPYRFPATGQQIRTVLISDEPWFVAADVCAALDLSNPSQTVGYLDDDERRTTLITNEGASRSVNIVSESGLYSLILRSRKAEAKAFKRWVTHEVLPAIRKTGRYEVAPQLDELEVARRYVAALEDKRTLQARVAELEPDAARARQTMNTDGLSLVRTVAKRFGIQEKSLREFLYAEKLLIRTGASRNEPYAAHVQAGHFEVKTTVVDVSPDLPPQSRSTTYVTPRGEALIWKRLHEAGYVTSRTMPPPVSEQLALVAA